MRIRSTFTLDPAPTQPTLAYFPTLTTASIADGAWHHYAILAVRLYRAHNKAYVDGTLNRTTTSAIDFGAVTRSLKAFIGALQTAPSGAAFAGTTMTGYGKLSGSMTSSVTGSQARRKTSKTTGGRRFVAAQTKRSPTQNSVFTTSSTRA